MYGPPLQRLSHTPTTDSNSPASERPTSWNFPAGARRCPVIIAHRGDLSTSPENTLPAFYGAYRRGADAIELDVRLTRDDKLIVFHDRNLKRITGENRLVSNVTLEEIRSFDVGSRFGPEYRGLQAPTLDEVFDAVPADFLVNVEMKAVIDRMRLIAHRVAEVIRRHERRDSTLVASFNPISLWELRKVDPTIMRGYIWSRRHPPPIRSRCFSRMVKAHWYDPANDSYNPRLMREMRSQGVRTLAWDVDFARDLVRMAEARLDAVVTDNLPELLRQRSRLDTIT